MHLCLSSAAAATNEVAVAGGCRAAGTRSEPASLSGIPWNFDREGSSFEWKLSSFDRVDATRRGSAAGSLWDLDETAGMTLERFLTSYHSSHSPRHSVTTVQTTARLRTSSTVCTTTTSPNATPVEWRPPAQPRQQPHRPLSHPQITSNALAGQQGRMMVYVHVYR